MRIQTGQPSRFGGQGFESPGRAAFEWAILFAATALVFPEAALLAGASALVSRRRGSPRWKTALALAVWCGLLGIVFRIHLGVRTLP